MIIQTLIDTFKAVLFCFFMSAVAFYIMNIFNTFFGQPLIETEAYLNASCAMVYFIAIKIYLHTDIE